MKIWMVVIGGALILDSMFILIVSNINLGVMLPSIIGMPIFITGLIYDKLMPHLESGLGLALKWTVIGLYLLYFALTAVSICVISVNGHKKVEEGADAVIVLGAAVHGEKISLTLQNRLDLAIEYIGDDNHAVIVVSGAKGSQEDISEAEASKRYLISCGFDENRIITEDRARNTFENFSFSKELLDRHFSSGYSAVFVTNGFHVYRAGLAAKEAGLDIEGIGCGAKAYIQPNNYLRESIAVWKYWLVGAR